MSTGETSVLRSAVSLKQMPPPINCVLSAPHLISQCYNITLSFELDMMTYITLFPQLTVLNVDFNSRQVLDWYNSRNFKWWIFLFLVSSGRFIRPYLPHRNIDIELLAIVGWSRGYWCPNGYLGVSLDKAGAKQVVASRGLICISLWASTTIVSNMLDPLTISFLP